jgi:hypothetical protein
LLFGSITMGEGIRIIIDVVVAGLLWLMDFLNFKRRDATLAAVLGIAVAALVGIAVVFLDPRLNRLASDGLLKGDSSMSARIFRMLASAWAWRHDWWYMLFGWGHTTYPDIQCSKNRIVGRAAVV